MNSAAFSHDGSRIVTTSLDGTTRIWDAASAKEIAVLHGHDYTVWSAAFSPDGSRIVTASLDGTTRIWDFHIDIAEVRTEEGKLHLFVAIDRTSKFAFAQLHEKANRHTATAFLKALVAVVPYKIHTILTDNGIQFCDLPKNRSGPTARWQTPYVRFALPSARD